MPETECRDRSVRAGRLAFSTERQSDNASSSLVRRGWRRLTPPCRRATRWANLVLCGVRNTDDYTGGRDTAIRRLGRNVFDTGCQRTSLRPRQQRRLVTYGLATRASRCSRGFTPLSSEVGWCCLPHPEVGGAIRHQSPHNGMMSELDRAFEAPAGKHRFSQRCELRSG